MPTLTDAIRYAASASTSVQELRRACALLLLPTDGDADELRARLAAYLADHDAARPVICLNPGPVRARSAEAGPAIPRPAPDEYAPVFAAEIGLVPDTDDFPAMLLEQLDVTRALASTFGEEQAGLRYAEDKWTVREVIGHVSDCERVLAYRLLRLLRGDETPLPGFDHLAWVPAARFETRALQHVVAEFSAVREATTRLIHSAAPEDFAGRVPVGSGSITGRGLAYLIAGHERHHQHLLQSRYLPCMPPVGSDAGPG